MEPSKAAMKAALRVLTALSERRQPNQSDVDELHWYAPSERERPIDELVCDAIQRALLDREQKRQAVKELARERALALAAEQAQAGDSAPGTPPASGNGAERLQRQARERRDAYLALTAKLQAAVTREEDLSAVTGLLNEHMHLTRQLIDEEQMLRKHGLKKRERGDTVS